MKKYLKLVLNTKPNNFWKTIRFLLHWLSLPLKLIIIGTMGLYQIIRHSFLKKREVPNLPSLETKQAYFNEIFQKLPIWKFKDEYEIYTNRVPYYEKPDGTNHNTDHQCSRHGTFTFLMDKLNRRSRLHDVGLALHVKNGELARGYDLNIYQNKEYNFKTVSGDMLIGLCLGMIQVNSNKNREPSGFWIDITTGEKFPRYEETTYDALRERFAELFSNIVDNDYGLIERVRPDNGDPEQFFWDELEAFNERNIFNPKTMKSIRAVWAPGLETVGAQALTLLVAARVSGKLCGSLVGKREYRKLLFRYGYGLLSLIPTAFTKSSRGYFNDHNCMVALYVLSKLAEGTLGRLFWKIPMYYVWSLSKNYYNGYFTGLLEDAHPGTVSQEYINDCVAYLYEAAPNNLSFDLSNIIDPKEFPVAFNKMNQGEFHPEMEQKILFHESLDRDVIQESTYATDRYLSGLGFIAHAIMLEKDPSILLSNEKSN